MSTLPKGAPFGSAIVSGTEGTQLARWSIAKSRVVRFSAGTAKVARSAGG